MPIGSTRRKNGLKIPKDWEVEFKEQHPRNREKEKELFEKLEHAIQKMKDKEAGVKEGQTGGRGVEQG